MNNEMTLDVEVVELPPKSGLNGVVTLFKRAIRLPHVTSIEVTSAGIRVSRYVLPGERVIPESLKDYEVTKDLIEPLLAHVKLIRVPTGQNVWATIASALNTLADRGAHPVCVVAPNDPTVFERYIGAPAGAPHMFGLPVYYTLDPENYNDQCIVLGGGSLLADDLTHGVIFDLERTSP